MQPTLGQDTGLSPHLLKRHASRRSVVVTLVAITLIVGAAAWLLGWFAAPLQGDDNRWTDAWETETEVTQVIGWFLPRPSTPITLTDAWLEDTDGNIELVSVQAARTRDDDYQIGTMSADDPELDRFQFRPLAGTVIEPPSGTVNDWYVVFEFRWSPRHPDDFAIAGPMHLSYRDGLRRLEYRECGFIVLSTPQARDAVDEAAEAAYTECTGR